VTVETERLVNVNVSLKSILRDRLPPEKGGQAILDMPKRATLADLAERLDIKHRVIFVVNGQVESNVARRLNEGDQVALYVSAHGG
jgi:hypothetical protein